MADVAVQTATPAVEVAPNTNPQPKPTGSDGGLPIKGEKSIAEQVRELSDQDLDAVVKKVVNGKEEKVKVRDLIKAAQLQEATEQKYQKVKQSAAEAQAYKAQLQQLATVAKTDPKRFFQELGVDPYEFAEATLTEKLKLMEMSPEARELQEVKQKLAQKEQSERELKKKHEENEKTQSEQKYASIVDKEIADALRESGLPKTKYYATRIPYIMMRSIQQARGGDTEPMNAKQAAEIVKKEFLSEAQELLTGMDINQIRELLGDKVKALREDDVKRFQNQGAEKPKDSSTPTRNQKKDKPAFTQKEWEEWVESKKNK